jgi:hypothetical protein
MFPVRRLGLASAPNPAAKFLGDHSLLLQRLVHVPIERRCVRGYSDRKLIRTVLVSDDVAMACSDNISSHRFSIRHWLRELLRPDGRGNWPSNISVEVRATLHDKFHHSDGRTWGLYPRDMLYVVDHYRD